MPEPRAKPSPKIAADRSDVAGYRRTGAKPRSEGGGSGFGVSVLLALLVAGLAGAGWFITTQHQQLTKAELALTQADRRLAVLEERLQVTDQVMSESGTEVQSKLGQWESEIRKLWDASKRQNQTLTNDQAKLKAHDGSIDGMQTAIKDLKSSDQRQEQVLAQQTAIAQQLATVDQQVKQLISQQRQLVDQVNAVRQSLAGLESGLTRRVVANEKAVEAIDAYRLQLNSRLVDLQTRVDGLASPKTP
jgi:chromosome segregation ATPase